MIKPIYLYGEDALRKKSEDVDLNDPELSQFIEDMFETMRNANGAGLAAPQIGINKNVIVIGQKLNDGLFKGVFINPKIKNYSGYLIRNPEGCLSFPGIEINVNRVINVEVEWYDENKKFHTVVFSGIKAIILQHEIDHLNGILFIDKIPGEDKLRIFKELQNIRNKKVNTNYETK
jgi:peptide deformylase